MSNGEHVSAREALLNHLQREGYDRHSKERIDTFCSHLLKELVRSDSIIESAANKGQLVFERQYPMGGPDFLGEVDLVIGPPDSDSHQEQLGSTSSVLREAPVGDIWFALDFETLWGSVLNNWKNRGREIHSFYRQVYGHHPTALTGVILLLNIAELDDDGERILRAYNSFEFAEGGLEQELDALSVIRVEGEEDTIRDVGNVDVKLSHSHFVEVVRKGMVNRLQGELDVSEDMLGSLTAHDEGTRLEFKEELPERNHDFAKEAVAMANKDGGNIIIGIANNGTPVGLKDPKKTEEDVANILNDNPEVDIVDRISIAKVNGSPLVLAKIKKMDEVPADINGTFYVRVGSTTRKLHGRELVQSFCGR